MRTVVINTGTELLLGDVLNTHLAFLAQEIFALGLRIDEQRTLPDGKVIQEALTEIFAQADAVFVTGGLGPTTDDITRELVAELLGLPLEEDTQVREKIHARLSLRNVPMPDRIWRQAQVPRGGRVLPNENGTAPGIYLPANVNPRVKSPHLFLLPGPPRELRPMVREAVLPVLRGLVPGASLLEMRRYRFANLGESVVEHAVGEQLLAIRGLEVGYCARPGEVDLRLIGSSEALKKANEIVQAAFADRIFAMTKQNLAEVIVELLAAHQASLALAESCTGGFLANEITNIPGASAVLRAGFVPYSNEAKTTALGVSEEALGKYGAVSAEVARSMAEGARDRSKADYALGTTGIAGPEGGSAEKPVGTVFIALAVKDHPAHAQKFFLPTDRLTFKQMVAQNAFELLRRQLLAKKP